MLVKQWIWFVNSNELTTIKITEKIAFFKKAIMCYLSITGVDIIGTLEIYKKYMTFSRKN